MNTRQTYNNRYYWLTIKRTIGTNHFSSFLDTGYHPNDAVLHGRNIQIASQSATYTIDLLRLLAKISVFWEKLTAKITHKQYCHEKAPYLYSPEHHYV